MLKRLNPYAVEYAFLATTITVSILGFWELYFADGARPNGHHHLHALTNFAWLSLLLCQVRLIETRQHGSHRAFGLAVLVLGPLLVASTALLSVHSAHKGLVSGQGDTLLVQNVMGVLELAALLLLAFVLRRRRKLHGAFLLSTALLFLGIGLFFALISFAPPFRIEGPETFHRFGTAAATSSVVCIVVGLLFVVKDWRNNWPMLLAGVSFTFNELVKAILGKRDLVQPLTEFVGGLDQTITFLASFVLTLAALAATGILGAWQGKRVPRPA